MPNPSPAPPPNLDSGFRRNDAGQRRTWLKKFAQAEKNLKHTSTKLTKNIFCGGLATFSFLKVACPLFPSSRHFQNEWRVPKMESEIPTTPILHHSSTPFSLCTQPRQIAGIIESFQTVNKIDGSLRAGWSEKRFGKAEKFFSHIAVSERICRVSFLDRNL
jgi:hypothetical protein